MCVKTNLEIRKDEVPYNKRDLMMSKMKNMRRKLTPTVKTDDQGIKLDALAVVTAQQKHFVEVFYKQIQEIQRTKVYKVLFSTTQPAHVIAFLAILVVGSTLLKTNNKTPSSPSPYTNLIYLAAFSIHFGAQFWMTFISGLSLYFNLSRHAFGAVQKVLFPKYFSLNSFLSLVTLISYTRLSKKSTWDFNNTLQTSVLTICFLLELLIRLYIVPPVLHLISVKTEVEAASGVGQEVGHCDPGPLRHCPYYKKLHSQFRRLHMTVAIGNIVTMACTAMHLHSLAHQWTCV